MKKLLLSFCLVVILAASGVSVGCGGEEGLSLVTANVGGDVYLSGVALGEILNRYGPVTVTPEASTGSARNVELMEGGYAEMAILSALDTYEATHGVGPRFEKNHAYSVVMPGHMAAFYRIVKAGSPITTMADIKGSGARIWPYPMTRKYGGVWLADLNAMQKYHDFTDDDLTAISYYTLPDMVDAMKEGRHELLSYTLGVPNATITELIGDVDCRFISIDAGILDSICVDNPYFFPYTMEAGTYSGQDYDVNMSAYVYFLLVKNDLDEDLVYDLAKALYDNYEELAAIHPLMADYSIDYIDRNTVAPWHPGVIKYFEEKGVWTSDLAELQSQLLAEVK
jgi:TRAP transporter TAXI family solute receptor